MATELELCLSTHDAIYDVNLSKTKSRQLHHQWVDSREILEDPNIDDDYKHVLRIIFDKSDQIHEQQHKRKRENVVYTDEKDDSDVEICRTSRNRDSLVTRINEARPGEKDKVQRQISLEQSAKVKGKNVAREDYEAKKKVGLQIDDEQLCRQSNLAKKNLEKSRNEVDKGRNAKGSCHDEGPDHKYLHLHQNFNLENDRHVHMDKGENSRKLSGVMRQKIRHKHRHEPQNASVKKTEGLTQEKSRNVTGKVDNMKGFPNNMVSNLEYHHFHQNVKLADDRQVYMHKGHALVKEKISGGNDKEHGMRKLSTKQKVGVSNQMTYAENQGKRNDTHPTSMKKLTMGKSRNEVKIERNQSPTLFNKTKNLTLEKSRNEEKGKDSSDSDVEILDSAAINEEGVVGPFVPSKKFHKSMQENRSGSSASEEFRTRVLDVLKRPFDKEEYAKHQQAVKSYLDYHPDLRRKLTKYRYKQGKRMTIYRGFFFWLQNLTQEGSFKPWEDRECLTVEPGSA